MSTIVVMPGGFHPFHAGHMALYQSAVKAFPGADVYVAASNDTSERPFPFSVKEKLAKASGVPAGHFVQVKSPFRPSEITDNYDPEKDVLVFVRSEKDRNEQPKPGGMKKDGTPAYFQPWTGKDVQPFGKHAYLAYLPTVEFGPGITSATEIRNAWPTLNDKRKLAMVMSLYPAAAKNTKLAQNIVKIYDSVMGQAVAEKMKMGATIEPLEEDEGTDQLAKTVIQFYKPVVDDIHKEKVDDYTDKARELLHKTDSPEIRKKLIDIFKKGKENPYIQGGIVTTVGALLAGGILSTSQKMGLTPAQTNLVLQAILNTVIPTVVSRINGKNWANTIKYTLASAGIGTGIAAAGLTEGQLAGMRDYFAKQMDGKPQKQEIFHGLGDYNSTMDKRRKEREQQHGDIIMLLHKALKARKEGKPLDAVMRKDEIAKLTMAKADGTLAKITKTMTEEFHTGGSMGLPYPGTYEQENNRTKHQDVSRRIMAMTETNITESADYLEEK